MEPSFNNWTLFFLIASFQGLFLSIMLFARRSKTNNLLGSLILSFSICMGYYVIFWTGYFRVLPGELGVLQGLPLVFGPLTYFYLKSDHKNTYFDAKHFVGLLVYIIAFISNSVSGYLLAIFQVVHLVAYALLIFRYLSTFKEASNGTLKRLQWRKKVAWAFSGYVVGFATYYVLVWTQLLKIEYDYIISLASSFFIYFIGYHGFQKQEVLKMNENGKYDRSSLNSSASRSILTKLNQLMREEKLFLESSLKLQTLATRLELQPHHISQVINELEEKNFSDYVNGFRIEKAKSLLRDTDQKVINVAYETGFNNKATFNNAFKKITGMSPSEFREQSTIAI